MQSKVIENLEELDREKTIELARWTKQFEEREKLQTEYEGVQNKTAYGYYKDDAEIAFSDEFGDDPKYTLQAYLPEKIKWMKEWAKKKELKLNERYKNVDTEILTKEEFLKPLDDYYNAKRKDYLNPQNVSLVHRALGKIGFGTDRHDTTGNFLDKEGKDVVAQYYNDKSIRQKEIQDMTHQRLAEIRMENFNFDNSIKLTTKDFATLLDDTALFDGTSDKAMRGKRLAYAEWYNTNQSYDSALQVISSHLISYDTKQTQATLDDVRNKYIQFAGEAPKDTESAEYKKWHRGLKSNIALAFNMGESLSVQRINRAHDLFDAGLTLGQYKPEERAQIVSEIIGQDLLAATGGIDYNQIKADIIREKTLENLLILQEDLTSSARARQAQATIKQINFMESEDKQFLEDKLSDEAYNSLKDANFDMEEWNKKYSANIGQVDLAIIRELQTSLWLQQGTNKAFIAADSVVAELKKVEEATNQSIGI